MTIYSTTRCNARSQQQNDISIFRQFPQSALHFSLGISAHDAYMQSALCHTSVCPSVRPSVCHTGWSVKNRQEVHHAIFTI